MSRFLRAAVASILVALPMSASATDDAPTKVAAAERTRTFPAQKCRYALPGKDWSWVDPPPPNTLCMAENTRELAVVVTARPIPNSARGQPMLSSAEEFEKGFYGAA